MKGPNKYIELKSPDHHYTIVFFFKTSSLGYNYQYFEKPLGFPCTIHQVKAPSGLCIEGSCHPIGCDKILGSILELDQCGICGGNGSRCLQVNGTWNSIDIEAQTLTYIFVGQIPEKSWNFKVVERG